MKPIFEQEREFLKSYGVEIPQYCWRDGSKIYLNANDEIPIIVFKVDELNDKIVITKNFIKKIEGNNILLKGKYKNKKFEFISHNKTFEEELDYKTKKRINKLIGQSVKMTIGYLNDHTDYETRLSISGGKDSTVMNYIFKRWVLPKLKNKEYKYDGYNTTNDTSETYKQMYKEGLSKEDINNPLIYISDETYNRMIKHGFKENKFIYKGKKRYANLGWYQWIIFVKKGWIPNALKRACCSTYKEGQIKLKLDKNKKYVMMTGVRKYESSKRSKYEFDMQKAFKKMNISYNMPYEWKRISPICYFKNVDIWLMILMYNIEVNEMYKFGFNRVGCLICPYASPYTNLLIKKYYKFQWNRWANILEYNYESTNVKKRLKWTMDEYIKGGKWSTGLSKEYELISKKPTKERIKELSKIKGISYNMAEKYWNKKCKCGNKLNPDEIAMSYKILGRFEDVKSEDDNRDLLCKECMCKNFGWDSKKYMEKVSEFRNGGCNLF